MNLSAKEVMDLLQLEPNQTCGMVRHTYISKLILPKSVLPSPFTSDHPAGAVLYFMVTPETQILLHKIRSDQMYHFYFGTPLDVLLLYSDGTSEVKTVGDDIKNGMTPQLFIPGGTFHVSKLHTKGDYSLLATTEWPSVVPEDVTLGDPDKLIEQYPTAKQDIIVFTKK